MHSAVKLITCLGLALLFIMQIAIASAADIPVLLYHKTAPINNDYCIAADVFEQQIRTLAEAGYQTISMKQLHQLVVTGEADDLPPKPLLITFDDGYRDTYTVAYPILKKYNYTALIFMITDYFDQPNYLTPSQMLEMNYYGFGFGSHTASHLILTQLSADAVNEQLVRSKKVLEGYLGKPVDFIAFPCGKYNDSILSSAQAAGYIGSFTTQVGLNRFPGADPYRLRRIPVFHYTDNILWRIRHPWNN